MDLERCWELIHTLERDPAQMPAFYGELEASILWLMDTTFTSADPAEKVRLATTEMRARLVLERYRKAGRN